MAQIEGLKSPAPVSPVQGNSRPASGARVHSSQFKFYIHDGVDSCRMQLIGELSGHHVPELNGCWSTAKTSLGNRKMLLDVRNLTKFDEPGRQWIISMSNEGALLLPETFLADGTPENVLLSYRSPAGFFPRLWAFFRGSRTLPAQSPTQAQ